MLKGLITVAALAGASLMALPLVAPQAAPAMKPDVTAPASAAHGVKDRGGGGFGGGGGGFSRGMGGGGFSRGMGGGGFSRGMGGGGQRFGGFKGGPRVGGFNRGPGRSFYRDRGGPRFYGGGGGYRKFKGHAGRHHHHHHHKHHRRFRGFAHYGLPYVYAYSSYDDYSCAWLRRRAIYTGSSYWWRRYEECRYGYDD